VANSVRAVATAEDVIVVIVAAAVSVASNAARNVAVTAVASSKAQRQSRAQMKVHALHNARINPALSKNHKSHVRTEVRDETAVRGVRGVRDAKVAAVGAAAVVATEVIVASARCVTIAQPGSKTLAHWAQQQPCLWQSVLQQQQPTTHSRTPCR
jgi:hypothetical protein